MIDWASIRPVIKAQLAEITGLQVVWQDQRRPYIDTTNHAIVLVRVRRSDAYGVDDRRYTDLGLAIPSPTLEEVTNGLRKISLDIRVQAFRHEDDRFAHNAAERIRGLLVTNHYRGVLRAVGVAVAALSNVVDVPIVEDDRLTSVAALEATLVVSGALADTPHPLYNIETVSVTSILGEWSPDLLPAEGWFIPDVAHVSLSGGLITQLDPTIGSGYWNQGVGSERPTWVENHPGFNNLPAILYPGGSGDELDSIGSSMTSPDFTLWCAVDVEGTDPNRSLWNTVSGGTKKLFVKGSDSKPGYFDGVSEQTFGTTKVGTQVLVWRASKTDNTCEVWRDGVLLGTGTWAPTLQFINGFQGQVSFTDSGDFWVGEWFWQAGIASDTMLQFGVDYLTKRFM